MYSKNPVSIAKRENNKQRNYLVVNRLQAKHVPALPSETLEMFDSLAGIVRDKFQPDSLLLIGFAETATAIGSRLAVQLGGCYMQTTRENIDNVEYLFFTESHSHASEQRLIKTDLDKIIGSISDIVFVEDEITTGNTIYKIVNIIRETYPEKQLRFSAVSLLNGMDSKALLRYRESHIETYYLIKTDHRPFIRMAEQYRCDGKYIREYTPHTDRAVCRTITGAVNSRRAVSANDYDTACRRLAQNILSEENLSHKRSLLVVGTEECMYPAIYTAYQLEQSGMDVRCHSTTRSPIAVSTEADYPLHCRYELDSIYEYGRKTFIYDLKKYDKVIIITDAAPDTGSTDTLIGALQSVGNDNIEIVRWC